ncbi:MAG: hypothetical protein VX278_23570 [Myxococcota bacterium]|nr:hypothetical protein [Myxococcota bacterium]
MKQSLLSKAFIFLLALSSGTLHCTHQNASSTPGHSMQQGTIQHKGYKRSFMYYTPSRSSPSAPLIFIFHSSNSSPLTIQRQFGYRFEQIADKTGAIIVYPHGFQKHWNDCRKEGPYAANRKNLDDVGFVEAMIAFFEKHHSIDEHKIFATGLSNGGNFVLRLALESVKIHAVAALGTNFPTEENFDCQHSNRAISFLLMNGTADPVNPYKGGVVSLYGFGKRGRVLGTEETIEYWSRNAGNTSPATLLKLPNPTGADQTLSIHESWKNSAALIELDSVHGVGHNIPAPHGADNPLFGPRSKDYWGADVIYDFFERSSTD